MAEEKPASKRTVHWAVKVLVLAHLIIIFSWSLPPPPPAIAEGRHKPTLLNVLRSLPDYILAANDKFERTSPHQYWLISTGTWQGWDMFAPDPSNLDIWLDAEIEFADGTVKTHAYPRMYDLSLADKYFQERFRKYVERVNGDNMRGKWPTFARRMALEAYTEPENPPVRVTLRRHFRYIERYPQETPDVYTTVEFYTHFVDQERLLEMSGW